MNRFILTRILFQKYRAGFFKKKTLIVLRITRLPQFTPPLWSTQPLTPYPNLPSVFIIHPYIRNSPLPVAIILSIYRVVSLLITLFLFLSSNTL